MLISRRIITQTAQARVDADGGPYQPEAIVFYTTPDSMASLEQRYVEAPHEKSMHFVIGQSGLVHQYVEESDIAQHLERIEGATWANLKPDIHPNNYTIGIQIAELNGAPLSEYHYNQLGQLVHAIGIRWGIPIDRAHIIHEQEINFNGAVAGTAFDLDKVVQAGTKTTSRHPVGKGMFVWRLHPLMQRLQVDTKGLVASAQKMNLSWLVIKGAHRTDLENADLLPQVLPVLKEAGIKVWLYQRMHGDQAEVDTALYCLNRYEPDGWVLDAEDEYKGKHAQAKMYMHRIRERYPVLPIGLCSFRFPSYHRNLPWREFLSSCDFHAPQVYWQNSISRYGSPAAQLKRSIDELTGAFPSYPDLFDFRQLAVVPVGCAYKENGQQPTQAQLDEFNEAAKALQLPGICWFRWEHAYMLGFDAVIARHKWSVPSTRENDIDVTEDTGDDQTITPDVPPILYIVRPGDNLYRISRAHGTTVEILAEHNGIVNPNHIVVGQVIRIPALNGNNPAPVIVHDDLVDHDHVSNDQFVVVDLVNDLPKHPNRRYPTRSLDEIQQFVIHHTATHADTLVRSVARYHVETHGWAGIGYSIYITKEGTIYQTNHLTTVSRAASGIDRPSLNVCMPGLFMGNARPTPAQIAALRWLFHEWVPTKLGRKLKLVGHYELGDTLCPGDSWHRWCREIDANKIVNPARVQQVHPGVAID